MDCIRNFPPCCDLVPGVDAGHESVDPTMSCTARGIDLIELLLRRSREKARRASQHDIGSRNEMNPGIPLTTTSALTDGVPRLDLKTIAAYLATDKPTSSPTMEVPVGGSDGSNGGLGFDLGNLDLWLQYFDSSLMP